MTEVDHRRFVDAAIAVLRRNDRGAVTTAAPRLYPHQWSWDAAFVAIGWSHVSIPRAITELRSLLAGQWSTGMIPHIVFSDTDGYFPGPEYWRTAGLDAAPRYVATSGICQPPVHAIAVRHVLDRGRMCGGVERALAEEFVESTFDQWLRWHRYLARERDPEGVGLIEIHHSWESGWDNSPRWDEPYAAVEPRDTAFTRLDGDHVKDPSERPSDEDYARYLRLVDEMAAVGFDDAAVRDVVSFRVRDVFFSAVMARASAVLAGIGDELGRREEAAELRDYAQRFAAGVESTIDPATGLARDVDVRTGRHLEAATLAGFAPLISSTRPDLRSRLLQRLDGPDWMGAPGLRYRLPPSTSPASPRFHPRTYWRGPIWPFLTWFLAWSTDPVTEADWYRRVRTEALAQLADLSFAEYYEPFTGEPLGSCDQAWTAAVALEWLAGDRTGTRGISVIDRTRSGSAGRARARTPT